MHIPYRVRKFYGEGKTFCTVFYSRHRDPAAAFANFYHLVDELHAITIDGLTVKRLTEPMKENFKQQDVYPAENTYRVKDTGEIFKSSTSHILQSYADYRRVSLVECMDWTESYTDYGHVSLEEPMDWE